MPYRSDLYLICRRFVHAQPWWATVNHYQSRYGPYVIKRWNGSKNSLFLATSENLKKSSLLPITWNPQLDNIEIDFHFLFCWKTLFFTMFSGIMLNPIVLFWYLHTPFLSNIETQVNALQCSAQHYIVLYYTAIYFTSLLLCHTAM